MTDFQYFNNNPNNEHIEDCVCRAISTAAGLNYRTVNKMLNLVAQVYSCDKLCVNCYQHLLSNIFDYTCHYCNFEYTVQDIAESRSDDTLIIRVKGHLTCSVKGKILDIWDCSEKLVDCYWVVE